MVTATAEAATNIATGKVRASGGGVHDSCKGKGKAKALASASHGMEMLAYSDNDSPQQGTCSRSDSAKGSDKGKGKAKAAASSPSSHGSVSSPKMSTLGSENAKAIAAELPTDDDNAEEDLLLEHVQEAFPDHQTKLLFEKVFDSGSIEDRIDKVITYCTGSNSADAAKLLKSIKDGSRRSTAILPGKNTEAILLDCVFVTNEIGDPRQSDPDGRGCLARIAIPKGTLVWDNAVQWTRKRKVPRHLEGTGNYVKYADGFFLLHKTAPPQPFKATSFFLNEARDSNKLPAQRQPNIKWQIRHNTHTSTKAFLWRFLKDVKADEEIVCAYDQDFAGGRKNKDRMSPKVTISDKENAKQSGNSNSKNTNTSTNMSTSAGSSNSNSNKKKKRGAPSKAIYVRKISDDDAQWVRYASCSKAAQQVGVSNCNISNCCHGKIKEAGGYEFTFMPSSLSNASGSGSGNGNSVSANTNTSTNMSERTDDELSESMEDSEESNEVIDLCSSSESEEEEGEGSGDNQRKMEAADYQASIPEQNCSGEDVERPRKRIRPSFQ